jgi:hypothetical protein
MKSIKKIVEPTGDLCVKFTEEEMSALGIKAGDKFSFQEIENGFVLNKYTTLDINLSEFSRETLEYIIQQSCERDVTVNEIIEQALTNAVDNTLQKK